VNKKRLQINAKYIIHSCFSSFGGISEARISFVVEIVMLSSWLRALSGINGTSCTFNAWALAGASTGDSGYFDLDSNS
jgi:hypothetical protein